MDDYKDKLLKEYERLNIETRELERIIDLIKESNTLDFDTRAKTTAFLEGYMTGLKETVEWINCIV